MAEQQEHREYLEAGQLLVKEQSEMQKQLDSELVPPGGLRIVDLFEVKDRIHGSIHNLSEFLAEEMYKLEEIEKRIAEREKAGEDIEEIKTIINAKADMAKELMASADFSIRRDCFGPELTERFSFLLSKAEKNRNLIISGSKKSLMSQEERREFANYLATLNTAFKKKEKNNQDFKRLGFITKLVQECEELLGQR